MTDPMPRRRSTTAASEGVSSVMPRPAPRSAHGRPRGGGGSGGAGRVSRVGRGVRDPQSFDHLPARYDRYAELVGNELRAWLFLHLSQCAGAGRALDAGCGTGAHTGMLADRFNEVQAVDLSEPMIDYARTHRAWGNVRYEVRDLLSVTVGTDGLFDAVVCAYTLHHLPDLTAALWHLRSLLRPGGTVLLVDVVDDRRPVPRSWLRTQAWRGFRDDLTRRRRTPAEAVELLRLSLDPDWLDHQSTDRLTPPAEWDALALSVFPDAAIATLDRAHAVSWRAPDSDSGHRNPGHTDLGHIDLVGGAR